VPSEDLQISLPSDDLLVVPIAPDLAITTPLTDLAVVSTDIGPPGPKGDPGTGAATVIVAIAAQSLGGHRVVKPVAGGKVNYASSETAGDGDQILGITQGAAVADAETVIQTGGVMEEPSWDWPVGAAIYCGISGLLTATPPTEGFLCRIAKAIEPTKILINVEEAFILA
jgi:hypothetical protein